jgi:hypothetical protein
VVDWSALESFDEFILGLADAHMLLKSSNEHTLLGRSH